MGALRNPLARRARPRARALRVPPQHTRDRALARHPRRRSWPAGVDPERIVLVPNASDLELFSPALDRGAERARLGLGNGFVCSYFGTMGEANDLTQVVRAAPLRWTRRDLRAPRRRQAARRPGARGARARGRQRGLPRARPPTSRRVARLAAASDACLTIFKDVPMLATYSPNKLFDTFAAGRPAIVNQPGWMRELVEDQRGRAVRAPRRPGRPGRQGRLAARPPGRGRSATAATRALLAEREFDRDALAARALAVLEEARALTDALLLRGQHQRPRAPAGLPRRDRAHASRRAWSTSCSCSTTPPTTARPRRCGRSTPTRG